MLLHLTYCFILTFSQSHLVNSGVLIHFQMPEIMQISDLFTGFNTVSSFRATLEFVEIFLFFSVWSSCAHQRGK